MVCGTSSCVPEAASTCSLGPPFPAVPEDPSKHNMQASSLGPVPQANPAGPNRQTQGGPPRYCCLHDTSDRRKKGEPRVRGCKACGVQIETNYAEMSFCPPCSQNLDRCMVCGNSAGPPACGNSAGPPACGNSAGPPAWARFPPSTAPVKAEEANNANRLQIPSRYCSRHDTTLKRPKAEPKRRECTECHMVVESNYAEFSLCPPCSDREHRCVLCGCPAAGGLAAGVVAHGAHAGAASIVAHGGSCMVPVPLPSVLAR